MTYLPLKNVLETFAYLTAFRTGLAIIIFLELADKLSSVCSLDPSLKLKGAWE